MSGTKILSLWGMPGAGKSFWGKKLAEELSIEFVDLDEVIEKKAGISISDMVIEQGEPYFREREMEALNNILGTEHAFIISLGGGTSCTEQNLEILKLKTLSIWLNTNLENIVKNLEDASQSRPLIDPKSDLLVQMRVLLEQRKEYYKRADLVIEQPYSIHTLLKILPDSFKRTVRQ